MGDAALHCLIIQVLKSVLANRFFNFDFSLKTVIPILMNLALTAKFHEQTSLASILALKRMNSNLLASLIDRFNQKYQLKVGFAEFFLKNVLIGHKAEDENEHPLSIYGCLMSLGKFGPHIIKSLLLPKVPQIIS